MAVEAAGTAMQMPSGLQKAEVTLSPQSLCHYITDDELERLGEMRKEPVMEIFLWSLGAFMGALIPALQTLGKFQTNPGEVGLWDLLTLLIGVATLAVAIVAGYLWRQRSKTHKSMVETIRARPRAPVRPAYDHAA